VSKATGYCKTFSGKVLLFSDIVYIYMGILHRDSAAKKSAAYKPNQQINGKEGKGKRRNDSGIAFEQA